MTLIYGDTVKAVGNNIDTEGASYEKMPRFERLGEMAQPKSECFTVDNENAQTRECVHESGVIV